MRAFAQRRRNYSRLLRVTLARAFVRMEFVALLRHTEDQRVNMIFLHRVIPQARRSRNRRERQSTHAQEVVVVDVVAAALYAIQYGSITRSAWNVDRA